MQTADYPPSRQTVKPLSEKQLRFIVGLRRELGIATAELPATSKDGARLIKALLQKRDSRDRRAVRQQTAAAPPTLEQVRSIAAVSERVGADVRVPDTAEEARFVLDDLYSRERKSRRVADGSAG
jgi:hypothetical protein